MVTVPSFTAAPLPLTVAFVSLSVIKVQALSLHAASKSSLEYYTVIGFSVETSPTALLAVLFCDEQPTATFINITADKIPAQSSFLLLFMISPIIDLHEDLTPARKRY